ncbi:hypothetical protein OO013_06695 [Mangrovivirga sp. M17]|uniref:Uncharacterized protein n=1 Tax=Mangrovivirga halotolerans TaxID=2993936 RepID=A0ABT3RQT7_9BACT|nr:hypothetical protein [Mangrovivirga halotolerans]MCX2743545.1 hypothetical protein [Mangrovivirga halotolerans]
MKSWKAKYSLIRSFRSIPVTLLLLSSIWFFCNSILINITLDAYNEIRKEYHHNQAGDGFTSNVLLEEEDSPCYLHGFYDIDDESFTVPTSTKVPYLISHEDPSQDLSVPPPRSFI